MHMATDNDPLARLQARKAIHNAQKQEQAKTEAGGAGSPPLKTVHDSRLTITLSETTINEAATTAMAGLVGLKEPIYQRAGRLMRPASADLISAPVKSGAKGEMVKTTVLVDLNTTYLKSRLAKHFRWQRMTRHTDKDGKITLGRRFTSPEWDVPNLILAMQGDWPFPPITGILSAPTLRADGTLLDQPGYDAQTGLLLRHLPVMPKVEAMPTREDAEAALGLLLELLEEFPFVGIGRAVALSLILSMVARGALGQVPLHLFTAPTAGSGKSFLSDIVSMIATGRRAPVVAATSRHDEQEKRIAASMLSARPLVALDNLTGTLDSALLCQAVSQPIAVYRRIGGDKEIELDCRGSVFVANGNNIAIKGDLGRRTLFARLDAGMEKPWERPLKRNPLEMIARDRGRYIAAALTIPLAWQASGCPRIANTVANGFEEWMGFVRDSLMWVGEADVVSTMDMARSEDPDLQKMLAMFAAMVGAFGFGEKAGRTTAQIIEAVETTGLDLLKEPEPKTRALREALEAIIPAKTLSTNRLGIWLRAAKDNVLGGLCLCKEDNRTGTGRWWIEERKDHTD
jgi:putative DNA primase/helicase